MRAWPIISTRTRRQWHDRTRICNRQAIKVCAIHRVRSCHQSHIVLVPRKVHASFAPAVLCTTRAKLILGHFKPCTTDIYLRNDARMHGRLYPRAHPRVVQPRLAGDMMHVRRHGPRWPVPTFSSVMPTELLVPCIGGSGVRCVQAGEDSLHPRMVGDCTMRVQLICHFKPCMTEIYLHI